MDVLSTDLLSLSGITALIFVSTNADNMVLLLAFLADPAFRPLRVTVGYAVGMLVILALSWGFAWLAHFISPEYLGFLGVVPIAMGARRFYDVFLRPGDEQVSVPTLSVGSQVLAVALADVAHGPDTVVLLAALLADTTTAGESIVTGTYLLLVLAWCALGWYVFRDPRIGEAMRKYGHKLAPFVMMFIGVYIFLNTARDFAP